MAERRKPFIDRHFIKEYLVEAANGLYSEKGLLLRSIYLSTSSAVHRTELAESIMIQIHEKVRNFLWYSLALDVSTYLSSTSKLFVLICGVN